MKNWIIVLLIFVIPLGIFAWLESSSATTNAKEAPLPSTKMISPANGKAKLLKFSSPMCSDCKKVAKEMEGIKEDYIDTVIFEEINVSDGSKASNEAIKTYSVNVVPTLVFVDKNGKIIEKVEGVLTNKEIRTSLNNIK